MPHDLGATLDADGVATEFILEPRIRAFGARAFIVSERLGWREFDFLATARVVIYQGNVAQTTAVFSQFSAAVAASIKS